MKGLKHGNTDIGAPYSRLTRKLCIERDGGVCQVCGVTGQLHVHHVDMAGPHLVGLGANGGLKNLVTLCCKCHLRLHCSMVERNHEIIELRKRGLTYQAIGGMFGITRQRVEQLIAQYA